MSRRGKFCGYELYGRCVNDECRWYDLPCMHDKKCPHRDPRPPHEVVNTTKGTEHATDQS